MILFTSKRKKREIESNNHRFTLMSLCHSKGGSHAFEVSDDNIQYNHRDAFPCYSKGGAHIYTMHKMVHEYVV